MPKITKRVVDAAEPRGERTFIWDAEVKGFGLVTQPSGIKSYIFDYRNAEGIKRRITIGKHGGWTADQARHKAEDYRRLVRDGGDPLGVKQASRDALTVGELLDAYLASEAFEDKAKTTKNTDRGRIERHLRPLLGKRHANRVTKDDVRKALRAITEG